MPTPYTHTLTRNPCRPTQARFRSQIEAEGWFTSPGSNQAMRFGDLPPWAVRLAGGVPRELMAPEVGV